MSNKIYISAALVAALASVSAGSVWAIDNGAAGSENAIRVGGQVRENAAEKLKGARDQALVRLQTRGDNEISRRVNSLNKLTQRLRSMKLVSASGKDAIVAQLQAQIDALTALKTKILSSTNTDSALEYDRSITKDYRVYALTVPQGYIKASADRINSLVQKMEALAAKLSAKIAEAKNTGKDVATLQSSLADMNAKISGAKTKAQEAQALVADLRPDGGDKAKAEANAQALKNARDKIRAATLDLNQARKDANDIAKDLRQLGIKTSVGYGNASSTSAPAAEDN